jgi:hypothetical protein
MAGVVARAISRRLAAGDVVSNPVTFTSQAIHARRVRWHGYARSTRVSMRSRVNAATSKATSQRAIIPHSLHMAVIGEVDSRAFYGASDPFRSTP